MKVFKNALLLSAFALSTIVLSACGTKKQTVSQGQTIDTQSVSQIKRGMSKDQIRIILGSPSIIDNFSGNTWIYYYSKSDINKSSSKNNGKLVLVFTQEQLQTMSNGDGIVFDKEIGRGGSIITQPTAKKKGIFK